MAKKASIKKHHRVVITLQFQENTFVNFAAFGTQWYFDYFLLWNCYVALHMAQCYRKLKDNNKVRTLSLAFFFFFDKYLTLLTGKKLVYNFDQHVNMGMQYQLQA